MASTAEIVARMKADLAALQATMKLPQARGSIGASADTPPGELQLITDANAKQGAINIAQTALAAAQAQLATATADAAASAQALFDDLEANGQVAVVDATTTPPTVTIYSPVPPANYQATVVRVAT